MLKELLQKLQITTLNEMQNAALEAIAQKNDVMVLSPTGSGKTLAFLLPLVQKLNRQIKGVQAIVVVPSRELAMQIDQVFRQLQSGYKITCCYGGHSTKVEKSSLSDAPVIIVATPGRLAYHIREGNFDVSSVKTLVLDEFDKSLELGFEEDMSEIVSSLFKLEQKVLTSATQLEDFPAFLQLQKLKTLNFLKDLEAIPDIKTVILQSKSKDKFNILMDVLYRNKDGQSLVFCNHRDAVERITLMLADKGIVNGVYHGGLVQQDREKALFKFRNGTYNILVTTDLASRGLDIPEIETVIHYQIPHTLDAFIHRNGRTARMKASGKAYLLLSEEETVPPYLKEYEFTDTVVEEREINLNHTGWVTFYIAGGKKDKLSKMDIAGLLYKKGDLAKDEVGLIAIYDQMSYVAVKRKKAREVLKKVSQEKIKGKRYKIGIDE
ncbi:DEAD/DEAH box helicase [Pedobacter puniceum]|uniref:DEAD/DEAH box helicase n=1 Tax=Pedobacter puniceum TaxID=2666136 RepID=A0A7K0FK17_9SPHI|nr:DEAD/DEAH box helicase [Pedobacter puniceum]MRX46258.1 DEAD/DEAH box helicase [Pedobacter puniceum]